MLPSMNYERNDSLWRLQVFSHQPVQVKMLLKQTLSRKVDVSTISDSTEMKTWTTVQEEDDGSNKMKFW